jgi:hypothetical protein
LTSNGRLEKQTSGEGAKMTAHDPTATLAVHCDNGLAAGSAPINVLV